MKKVFSMLTLVAVFFFGAATVAVAEEAPAAEAVVEEAAAEESVVVAEEVVAEEVVAEEVGMHQALKTKFIEGGAGFMSTVAFCLILGLALCVERIIYLGLASVDSGKLLRKVRSAWDEGGVEAAMEVCRNTRGPVASIFYQGFERYDEGVDVMEKSVVSYGSVQMGQLESGLTWISLFIALAPMLGFMGTVVGMIQAFDQIQAMGDISPTAVAGGIKVALLTTVFGLIAAVILQIFYNYLVNKIDGIVNKMEDASISLMDIIVKYKAKH